MIGSSSRGDWFPALLRGPGSLVAVARRSSVLALFLLENFPQHIENTEGISARSLDLA